MMTPGWVKLHRSLLDHPIWTEERFTRGAAFIDLIARAAFQDHESFVVHGPAWIKRGQVLTTQTALAQRWQWDRETVRSFLTTIESRSMVRIETSKATSTGYTLVTILNYEKFQGDGEPDPASDPVSGPASDPASDPASMPHPCLIHASRHKKVKKGKKTISSPSQAFDPFGAAEAASNGNPHRLTPQELVELYNATVPEGHPHVRQLSPARAKKAWAYLTMFPDRSFWESAFAEIGRSAFLRGLKPGHGHDGFRADFDWLLTKGKDGTENVVKVVEWKYRDRQPATDEDNHELAASDTERLPYFSTCRTCSEFHKEEIACPTAAGTGRGRG